MFLKTVCFLQRYGDVKTPTPGFDFEACSAYVYLMKSKTFVKSICGGQFWYCGRPSQINQYMGNTGNTFLIVKQQSMYSNAKKESLSSCNTFHIGVTGYSSKTRERSNSSSHQSHHGNDRRHSTSHFQSPLGSTPESSSFRHGKMINFHLHISECLYIRLK